MSTDNRVVMLRPDRVSDREQPADARRVDRWHGRPRAAFVLRMILLLAPLAASLVASRVLFLLVGDQLARGGRWIAWGVLLVVGVLVALGTERACRRFLPLPMLMRLTLVFPDQAPSRYKVLRAAASPARLKEIADSGSAASDAATQVLGLVAELARHDKHTRGHSERVRVFADLIAEELGIEGLDRDKLRWSALVHDIGKLDVPATILNKPGRPDREEWAVLQGHPAAGEARSGALFTWLGEWAGGITEHHERWDGKGYPLQLAGTEITLSGRIVAVADAYETMTASRAYKKPMATAAARKELADCAGAQFDQQVVRAFLAVSLPKLMWRVGPLSFLAHLPFLSTLQSAGQAAASSAVAAAAPAAVAGLSAAAVVVAVAPAPAPAAPSITSTAGSSTSLDAPAPVTTTPATAADREERPVFHRPTPITTSTATSTAQPSAAVTSPPAATAAPGAVGPAPAPAPTTAPAPPTAAGPKPTKAPKPPVAKPTKTPKTPAPTATKAGKSSTPIPKGYKAWTGKGVPIWYPGVGWIVKA